MDSEILHITHVCSATASDRMSLSPSICFCQLKPMGYFRNDIPGFVSIAFTMELGFLFDRKSYKL